MTQIDKDKFKTFDNLICKLVPEEKQGEVMRSDPYAATWYILDLVIEYFEGLYLEDRHKIVP